MSEDRQSIIRRVQGLMAKTTGAGCSEEEAMAASAMVARLMNKYELSLTDIKLREQANCQEYEVNVGLTVKDQPAFMVCSAIEYLTDTKCWIRRNAKGSHVVFFGFETDTVVAQYIYAICDRAMLYAWMDYKATSNYKEASQAQRRKIQFGFDAGMASRIGQRLRAMKDEQRRENESNGRDLVVVKRPMVEAALAQLGIKIREGRSSSSAISGTAYLAGAAAGDRVAFNKGVAANSNLKVN